MSKARKEPRSLTPAESSWVKRLQRVLLECPSTLELSTVGDASLAVVCRVALAEMDAAGADFCDANPGFYGVEVASVRSACRIHGISG